MKKALFVLLAFASISVVGQVVKQQEKKLKIELSVPEAQLVIEALQAQPYNKVADLIASIVSQANAQMKPTDTTSKKK